MYKKSPLLLIVLFASMVVNAQKSIKIIGSIKDSIGLVPNATILNLNTKRGTVSNDEGVFEIRVRLGDSLKLSSVQHITKIIYISKATLIPKKIAIQLQIETTVLASFELKKHDLIGQLGIDLKKVGKKRPQINAVTLGIPNAGRKKMKQVDRELYTATTSSSGISLDHLLNTLSGRIKMLKRKKKIVEEDIDINFLLKEYSYDFEKNFKIKKEDTFRFLYFCRTDPLFNRSLFQNEFTLIKFLEEKAIEFYKLKSNLPD